MRDAPLLLRRLDIRLRAEGRHVSRAEFAPVSIDGWKNRAGFVRSQLEKAVARAARKSIPQAAGKRGVKAGRASLGNEDETAVWSQDESGRERVHGREFSSDRQRRSRLSP